MVRYFRKKRVLVCFTVLLACFILLFIHRLCTSPKKPRVVVEQGDRVKYICNRILSSCNIIILTLDNEELVQFRCKIIPKLIEIPFRDARASHNGLCTVTYYCCNLLPPPGSYVFTSVCLSVSDFPSKNHSVPQKFDHLLWPLVGRCKFSCTISFV